MRYTSIYCFECESEPAAIEEAMTATKHAPGQVVAMATHRSDREFPKTSGTRNNPKGSRTLPSRRAAPIDPRYLEPAAAVEAMTATIH